MSLVGVTWDLWKRRSKVCDIGTSVETLRSQSKVTASKEARW